MDQTELQAFVEKMKTQFPNLRNVRLKDVEFIDLLRGMGVQIEVRITGNIIEFAAQMDSVSLAMVLRAGVETPSSLV